MIASLPFNPVVAVAFILFPEWLTGMRAPFLLYYC
jgi:hypothetical protein